MKSFKDKVNLRKKRKKDKRDKLSLNNKQINNNKIQIISRIHRLKLIENYLMSKKDIDRLINHYHPPKQIN